MGGRSILPSLRFRAPAARDFLQSLLATPPAQRPLMQDLRPSIAPRFRPQQKPNAGDAGAQLKIVKYLLLFLGISGWVGLGCVGGILNFKTVSGVAIRATRAFH
ncbi:hypothetical protein ACJJTC_012862 [Scirpophaga incertulas]